MCVQSGAANTAADLAKLATSATSNGEEVASLRVHELQDDVPQAILLKAAERVMVDAVNVIGIRVNRVLKAPHLKNIVQFASGMGPRMCCIRFSPAQIVLDKVADWFPQAKRHRC
jgi:transcriptional accessory protein Tex/SPT6